MLPTRLFFDDFDDYIKPSKNNMMCDIYEENNEYHIDVDVPGFKKDDISIECEKGNLIISAVKKEEENTDRKYVHRERKSYEKCERSFFLGEVEEDDIKASFKDGILSIVVPKKKEDKPLKKKINID